MKRPTALALVLLSVCGAARAQVPLPADLAIAPPAPNIPAADAAFSGAWGNGAWGGTLPVAIVVERIDSHDVATIVDAVGDAPQSGVTAGWQRDVINFSGGWWAGWGWGAPFNTRQFATAGKHSKVPELWLYADHDSYYTLADSRKNFDAFRAGGGIGDFDTFDGIHGNGHALFGYIGMWDSVVSTYLRRIDGG